MSSEESPNTIVHAKVVSLATLIWSVFDRESMLPSDVASWPRSDALTIRKHLVPPQDPSAGPMPVGFAYFIQRELRSLDLPF